MEDLNKIGVVLTTCDRVNFYEKSSNALLRACKEKDINYVVVNDGKEKFQFNFPHLIETTGKTGVAHAKNLGIKYLLDAGCDYIFLHEDDLEIIDSGVFDAYINASKSTGIRHFNFGLHGGGNRNPNGTLNIRKTIKYPDGTEIDLYPNVLGAFSYYQRSVFEDIGLMDEDFFNALEHVDHTYHASLKGYTTPFRWFADIHNSKKYLKDIVPDHQQSVIRNENFQEIFQKGLDTFIKKNEFSVVQGYGPAEIPISEEECLKKLRDIYKNR